MTDHDTQGAGSAMAAKPSLPDQSARGAATKGDKVSHFLNAGAGTGKTYALVQAVVGMLWTNPDLTITDIAIITFTEKAGAELKGRIRTKLGKLASGKLEDDEKKRTWTRSEPQREFWNEQRLLLDQATIGTIHSFALELIRLFPLEVGCPPNPVIVEEGKADRTREATVDRAQKAILETDDGKELARILAPRTNGVKGLNSIIEDLVDESTALAGLAPLEDWVPPVSKEVLRTDLGLLMQLHEDKQVGRVKKEALQALSDTLIDHLDDPEQCRLAFETNLPGDGTKIYEVMPDSLRRLRAAVYDRLARRFLTLVKQAVGDADKEALARGHLTFDQIIDAAERLVSHPDNHRVREVLREKYKRIMVDEFQDTDPRQMKIVAHVLADEDAPTDSATGLPITKAGSLFVVGDPMQSIYGFRGADIAQFEHVKDAWSSLTEGGDILRLQNSFRSDPRIVAWVNATFSRIFEPEPKASAEGSESGSSAQKPPVISYQPLVSPEARQETVDRLSDEERAAHGPAVSWLLPSSSINDAETQDDPKQSEADDTADAPTPKPAAADEISVGEARTQEAELIAGALEAALGRGVDGKPWKVIKDDPKWDQNLDYRDARAGDCAILVPVRTDLITLVRVLRERDLPYKVQGSLILHRSPEIIELVEIVTAVDDPADTVALVKALRTSLLGCSDVDLFAWQQYVNALDGGQRRGRLTGTGVWSSHFGANATETSADADADPNPSVRRVRRALGMVENWRKTAHDAATLLDAILRDCPALASADDPQRADSSWPIYEFVQDETRDWQESSDGALGAYREWLTGLTHSTSKAADTSVSEGDSDAIQIMTIHAAKGLEFPIVATWGLSGNTSNRSDRVIAEDGRDTEVTVKDLIKTLGYDEAKERGLRNQAEELKRLWYVAYTRATSHIIMAMTPTAPIDDPDTKQRGAGVMLAARDAALAASEDGTPLDVATTVPEIDPARRPGKVGTAPATEPAPDVDVPDEPIAWAADAQGDHYTTVTAVAHEDDSDLGVDDTDDAPAEPSTTSESPGASPISRSAGKKVGTALHRAMELNDLGGGLSIADAARRACAEGGLPDETARDIEIMADSCLKGLQALPGLDGIPGTAPRHWFEAPIADFSQADGRPGIVGRADLVYEHAGALNVVDFKSDLEIKPELSEAYRKQVRAYVDLIGRAVGGDFDTGDGYLLQANRSGGAALEIRA